jgi:hypothetical protein
MKSSGRFRGSRTLLIEYTPGWDNKEAKRRITDETALVERRMPFVADKCASLRTRADALYSPRKWSKYGTIEKVKLSMLHDCTSIRAAASMAEK